MVEFLWVAVIFFSCSTESVWLNVGLGIVTTYVCINANARCYISLIKQGSDRPVSTENKLHRVRA